MAVSARSLSLGGLFTFSNLGIEDMGMKAKANRRQSPRYGLKADFFLRIWPYLDRVGKLMDVSRGGAAVEYLVHSQYEEVVDVEVDIFSAEPTDLLLLSVPCKVVYETRIEPQTSLESIETRRCGLRFERLSLQHSELLKLLLDDYVSHPFSGE
jgi:hypothetical protein